MKIAMIFAVTIVIIIGVVYASFSYQETYDKNCIAGGGKVTGFLRCTHIREDYGLPNPYTVDLELGKTFQHDELEIRFNNIEDSRCPLDVTCVWEGNVTAIITVSKQNLALGLRVPIGFTIDSLTPYEITLKDIQPHPISTEKPDYVATFEITKVSKSKTTNKSEPERNIGFTPAFKYNRVQINGTIALQICSILEITCTENHVFDAINRHDKNYTYFYHALPDMDYLVVVDDGQICYTTDDVDFENTGMFEKCVGIKNES